AKWKLNSYTVRFHDGLESNQTVDEEFFYGKKKALLASKDVEFVNNGYYISAWTAKINGKNRKFKVGEKVTNLTEKDGEVIDFYPVWNEITYTVTYKANGGKGSVKKQTVKGLDEFTLRKNSFTRKGYTADGWVDEAGVKYISLAGVSHLTNTNKANIVLNAAWVENEYTLKLCPGKGILPEGTDDYPALMCKYSDGIILPKNIYTKEGYYFAGWNTKENGKGTTYAPASKVSKLAAKNGAEVKLYPVWKKNNAKAYVIIYNANGGTGKMTETVMKKTAKLKANSYKKDGYKFAGWQDAEGNIYSNKAQIKWSKDLKGQILELTAVWNPLGEN
ncbi:MAG: InlB B-repeat-containing protein, partial [Lachnospiraceae bacterium]|nr:InlB B-repeat-containing protein [Lachnospiraceae bacterium]